MNISAASKLFKIVIEEEMETSTVSIELTLKQ